MRGVYIHKREGALVWGHILWMCHGAWTVNTFKGCTLPFVLEQARAFIHKPELFHCHDCHMMDYWAEELG